MSAALEFRGARDASEVAAAYELAARVFGPNYEHARDAKVRVLASIDPIEDPSDVIVALDRGEVVGLVRLVRRTLRLGGADLRVAGVTSVAVSASHRGTGVGVGVMDASLRAARTRGDDVSVLFARRAVDGWYGRFGYVGFGQHVSLMPAPGGGAAAARGLAIRAGVRAASMDLHAQAYRATSRGLPASFARDRAWWRALPERLRARPTLEFLTLRAASRDVGYALVEADRVWEVCVARAEQARLLPRLAGALSAHTGRALTFSLHPDHPLMPALMAENHTLSIRRAWDGGHMLAPLHRRAAAHLKRHGLDPARPSAKAGDVATLPVWTPLDEF